MNRLAREAIKVLCWQIRAIHQNINQMEDQEHELQIIKRLQARADKILARWPNLWSS